MITKQHWRVFQLVEQEKKGYTQTSELMEISREKVKDLLSELRTMQPDLFPVESEKLNLGNQVCSKYERDKYNAKIVSYEARKDKADNVEDEIMHKF